ncbi:MAG TPA: nucleotidyl transferase AbiEii/AbiGii toxin family protein [Patescibacteria group bacterium]|nr:nucleotidyl transferase AbiEii/AbiGii toxin family protein [Patescibacteria group bacterium]
MHPEILPENTKKLLDKLANTDFIGDFYLSGGTALALQIGHRESDDLDWFTAKNFDPQRLQTRLERVGSLTAAQPDSGTLNCFVDEVQLQFLHYPYPLLEPKIDWQGIALSALLDIACTKLITVSSRGSKKDFFDLYFLLDRFELKSLFQKLPQKYPNTDYNLAHILKSLTYFTEAEIQPDPRMHQPLTWAQVKEKIILTVKRFSI